MSSFELGATATEPARVVPREGLVLDERYELVRQIGVGGMGEVWAARQLRLERTVAVKFVHVRLAALTARLLREARMLAALQHPAVVQVFDVGDAGPLGPYVVMELLDGEGLDAMLARGRLTVRRTVELFLPVLDGLSCAHAQGIVHRDIKPANVFVQGDTAKLIDFGIALASRDASRLTHLDAVVGTPAYMAPEQVLATHVDERADVWGVAVTMLEAMTDEPVFQAESPGAVMERVVDAPIVRPQGLPQLDDALWSILSQALEKDGTKRIATAKDLRDRLAGWLASRSAPVHAAAPPPAPAAPPEADLDALIRSRLGDV